MTRRISSLFAATAKQRRRGESGAVTVEFAALLPVLLLVLVGMIVFGLALNQYILLWNGVGVAAQQFAINGTTSGTPASTSWCGMVCATPALASGTSCPASGTCAASGTSTSCSTGLCMTLNVNGTACVTNADSVSAAQSADSACTTALLSNAGSPAVISATYPCSLTVMQYDFWPNCKLSAQLTELVK
jgi:Flp pilus assembly protein TadG